MSALAAIIHYMHFFAGKSPHFVESLYLCLNDINRTRQLSNKIERSKIKSAKVKQKYDNRRDHLKIKELI